MNKGRKNLTYTQRLQIETLYNAKKKDMNILLNKTHFGMV